MASTEDADREKDPVDGESDRASQSDRRADPDFNRELENSITERKKQTFLTILDKMMQRSGARTAGGPDVVTGHAGTVMLAVMHNRGYKTFIIG